MISPLVRRRRLARELRELREQAKMTSEQLAKAAKQTRLKISRLENAHGRPNAADVISLVDALGVTGERWHELVQMARDAAQPGWWDDYGPDIGERQSVYADLESGAATIRDYHNFVVPGLLQTPAFIRARIEWSRLTGWQPRDVERNVEARVVRQRMLRRPGGPTYEVILEEVAVLRPAAPAAAMREQLLHLAELASDDPRVSIRVLPVAAEIADFWLPRAQFTLYSYADPGDPVVAAVDLETTDLVFTEQAEVAPYTQLYDRLRDKARSPADSLEFLRKAADSVPSNA